MATKSAVYNNRVIAQAENGSIEVYYKNTAACLREIAEELGFEYDEKWNTRQLGSKLIAHIQQNKPKATPKANSTKENGALKKAVWQQCGQNFEFEAVNDTCLQMKSNGSILSNDDAIEDIARMFQYFSDSIVDKFGVDAEFWRSWDYDINLSDLSQETIQSLLSLIDEHNKETDKRWKWWSNLDDSCRYVMLNSLGVQVDFDPWNDNGPTIISIKYVYGSEQSDIMDLVNEIVDDLKIVTWHPDADFTFEGLAFLPNLEELRIERCGIFHLYPDGLGQLTQLKKLSLYRSEIEILDEDDLNTFATLTNLEELNLMDTDFSEEQIEKIKELLPNCNVMHY